MSVSIILEELNMEQTSNHVGQAMTKNQKWVLASTASGFSLENMDIMFLSFALAPIIASLHISSTAAGWIGSITNLGMLAAVAKAKIKIV